MSTPTLTAIFKTLSNLTPLEPSTQDDFAIALHDLHRAHHGYQGPLHNLSEADAAHARSVFLTLHVLFPHELLPALDILDRALVTKLVARPDNHPRTDGKEDETIAYAEGEGKSPLEATVYEVFYIQSASAADQAASSRYRSRHSKSSTTSTYYEVRLDSWNCTCPAFSVSAFQCLSLVSSSDSETRDFIAAGVERFDARMGQTWEFGGTATLKPGRIPSCKHILAAVLATAAPKLFKDGVMEKAVSREELVAWGSGWGELGG
ncbi:hypothetical protein H2200_003716 [Cladophialophora chaetospira]|uniref:SWIM-type domain-containing protein n=1 Tax=Cladophialophora chaetospira TaxID=386627 RepID=A0AA38XET0_9EURO|nr:hypothetical protein H2200_003716 [Cladophialophora chaetospira]